MHYDDIGGTCHAMAGRAMLDMQGFAIGRVTAKFAARHAIIACQCRHPLLLSHPATCNSKTQAQQADAQ
jgi:hypothetical protein